MGVRAHVSCLNETECLPWKQTCGLMVVPSTILLINHPSYPIHVLSWNKGTPHKQKIP